MQRPLRNQLAAGWSLAKAGPFRACGAARLGTLALLAGAGTSAHPSLQTDVHSPTLAPDGAHVAFACDESTDGVYELFASPIDPAAPHVKLSSPLVAGGDVQAHPPLAISSTNRVVYVADALVDGVPELFSAPIDGSLAAVRLSSGWPSFASSSWSSRTRSPRPT